MSEKQIHELVGGELGNPRTQSAGNAGEQPATHTAEGLPAFLFQLEALFASIPSGVLGKELENSFAEKLRGIGVEFRREVRVENRGDGRAGRIDFVILSPFCLAIEIDRVSPRRKSVYKLQRCGLPGFIASRGKLLPVGLARPLQPERK